MTYGSESVANTLLLSVTVGRSSLSLLSKDFTWIFDNLPDILQTPLNVRNIQTFLTSLKGALAVHSINVITGSINNMLEVIDQFLELQLASTYHSRGMLA